jgi:hypothetical protein
VVVKDLKVGSDVGEKVEEAWLWMGRFSKGDVSKKDLQRMKLDVAW